MNRKTRLPEFKSFALRGILQKHPDLIDLASGAADSVKKDFPEISLDDQERCIVKSLLARLDRVHVFLAYQSEDTNAADSLKGRLEEFSAGKLDVFTYSNRRDNPAGREWAIAVRQNIRRAHWFIALLPEDRPNRSWPFYEAALFEGSKEASDLLIAVTRPGFERPPQLEHFQGFEADAKGFASLIDQLLVQPAQLPGWDAINDKVSPKAIQDASNEIVANLHEVAPTVEWEYFISNIELEVNEKMFESEEELPILNARVRSAHGIANIFGRTPSASAGRSFRELVKNIYVDSHGTAWLHELNESAKSVVQDHIPLPIRSAFQGSERGKDFHPHLSAKSHRNRNIVSIRVIFTSSLSPRIANIPRSLDAFVTAWRLANRFRWEVVEEFSTTKINDEAIRDFQRILTRMETEGHLAGTMDPTLVLQEIKDQKRRKIVEDIYTKWGSMRGDGGIIPAALKERNAELLKRAITDLKAMNRQFVEVMAAESPSVVARYWKK